MGSELLDIIGKESSQEITIRSVGSSKKMIVGNDAVNPITAMDDLNKLGVPFELSEFLNTDGTKVTKLKIVIEPSKNGAISTTNNLLFSNAFKLNLKSFFQFYAFCNNLCF